MNKENKRPPFTTYVRCRHTGTSPFKPNLGLPTVKPKRPNTINNQQERVAPISRIPQPSQNNPRRVAQREARSQLPVRNVNGRVRNAAQDTRRGQTNDSAPSTVTNDVDNVTVEATPLAENAQDIDSNEAIGAASVETCPTDPQNGSIKTTDSVHLVNENAQDDSNEAIGAASEETCPADPQNERIKTTDSVHLVANGDDSFPDIPLMMEVIEEGPNVNGRVGAAAQDTRSQTNDSAPSTVTNDIDDQRVTVEATPLAESNENAQDIDSNEAIEAASVETCPADPQNERIKTTDSFHPVANGDDPFPDIPLMMEVIEEAPLPRYSLCDQTQHNYRMKLHTESLRLSNMADLWEKIKAENELESDIQDDIDAAVGQTRLLLRSKFEQFRGLIDMYPTSNNIRPGDLGGFWDMIYIQVELLDSHYAKLEKLKENNWVVEMPQVQAKKKTKRGGKKKKNLKVKSKFREAMALRNNAEEPLTSVCPLPPGSPSTSNETFSQEVPRELVKTPRVNRIIERARRSRRSSIGIVIRSSITGKLF